MSKSASVTDEMVLAFRSACDHFVMLNNLPCDTHDECLRFEHEKNRSGIAAALAIFQAARN